MRTKLIILTIIAVVGAALGTGLVLVGPASASTYSRGVEDVDYSTTNDHCASPGPGCTAGAGDGHANHLRIVQRESIESGEVRFAGYETTGADPDDLWMAATIGSECRTGYRHSSVWIDPGWRLDAWMTKGVPEQVPANGGDPNSGAQNWSQLVPHPDARVMPEKTVAVNIPMAKLFVADDGASMVLDFDSLQEIYAHGESVIAQRVAAGMSEAVARSDGFIFQTHVATHARVACVHPSALSNRTHWKTMPYYLPLTIEFTARALAPGIDQAAGGGELSVPAEVTHAALTVLEHPHDDCRLVLSATMLSNADTSVSYRFIDPYGRRSGSYSADLQGLLPNLVEVEIDIPTVAPTGTTGIDVEAGGPATGNFSGTFRLEVTSPNTLLSNHAGFDVPPCPGRVNPDLDRPSDDLVDEPTPTHGGTPGEKVTGPHTTTPVDPTPTPTPPTTVPELVTPTTTTPPSPPASRPSRIAVR